MALNLPPTIYSTDQLLVASEELHRYQAGLAQGRRRGARATAQPTDELSDVAAALLEQLPAAKRQDDNAIEELRRQVEQLSDAAPAVTLVLAAPAPAKLKGEVVAWLRDNVCANVLVNFHVNPEIAGGVVIRGASQVFDCSFRTKLMVNPANFTKVLNRV